MTYTVAVNGKMNFMGIEIPVVSGGFGEDKMCVTDKTVAEIHETTASEIRKTVIRNEKRFKDGIDVIDLKTRDEITSNLLEQLGYSRAMFKAEHIYLLSERGYAKLIKIMDDDKSWEVHDKLVDDYFNMKQQLQTQVRPSYMIEDSIERAKAWIKEEEERKRLNSENEKLQDTIDKQDAKIEELDTEVNTLLDISDLPLDTIRSRIFEFMRSRYESYGALYSEFDLRYHIRSGIQFANYKKDYLERWERGEVKKKDMINSQLAYICDELEMAEELYLVMADVFSTDFIYFLKTKLDDFEY